MKTLDLLENGTVRHEGNKIDYDFLLENLDPLGEINDGEMAFFQYDENTIIELHFESSFMSGEDVNHTNMSIDDLHEHYKAS